jgi:hypothetical protein
MALTFPLGERKPPFVKEMKWLGRVADAGRPPASFAGAAPLKSMPAATLAIQGFDRAPVRTYRQRGFHNDPRQNTGLLS